MIKRANMMTCVAVLPSPACTEESVSVPDRTSDGYHVDSSLVEGTQETGAKMRLDDGFRHSARDIK